MWYVTPAGMAGHSPRLSSSGRRAKATDVRRRRSAYGAGDRRRDVAVFPTPTSWSVSSCASCLKASRITFVGPTSCSRAFASRNKGRNFSSEDRVIGQCERHHYEDSRNRPHYLSYCGWERFSRREVFFRAKRSITVTPPIAAAMAGSAAVAGTR